MSQKKPYHEQIAEKLIEQLQQGTAPWQKPWAAGEKSMPHNPVSGTRYKGANALWLGMQGRSDSRWMTYKQAQSIGAQVKKGEKSTNVQYWKFNEERTKKGEDGKPVIGEDGKPEKERVQLEKPKMFWANVFNGEQIDGLPEKERTQDTPEKAFERHERAEKILATTDVNISHEAGNRAFYRPSSDSITLPEKNQFHSPDGYYSTALHELGHATGHPSRLNRDMSGPFGSESYAREELRAEISSLMVGDELGVGHDPGQHAAYVGSWVKVLQEDPKEIVRASRDAEHIMQTVTALEQGLEQSQEVAAKYRQGDLSPTPERENQPQPPAQEPTAASIPEQIAPMPETRRMLEMIDTEQSKSALSALPDDLAPAREAVSKLPRGMMGFFGAVDSDALEQQQKAKSELVDEGIIRGEEPRWTVSKGEETILETSSAIEAEKAFREGVDRVVTDNYTSTNVAAVDWVNDGSFPRWEPSKTLTDAMEQESQGVDQVEQAQQAQQARYTAALEEAKAEAAKEARDIQEHQQNEARREAVEVEVGQPIEGLRAQVPLDWTGEARVHPVIVDGDAQAGDLKDREPGPGEQPTAFRVEVRDTANEWSWTWFSNESTEQDANSVAEHLNAIGNRFNAKGQESNQVEASGDAMEQRQQGPQQEQAKPTYLNVPYKEKDEAKALGAKWDRQNKSWYAPAGIETAPFSKWIGKSQEQQASKSPQEQFSEALESAGLKVEGMPQMDGQMHRVPVEGDRQGQTSGAYVGYTDGHPAGMIQNFRAGTKENWKANGVQSQQISPQERARLDAEAKERQQARSAERQAGYEKRAKEVQQEWKTMPAAQGSHPYLKEKGVGAHGIKQDQQGRLAVPATDTKGNVWSMQRISSQENGGSFKGFDKGTQKEGHFHAIGGHDAMAKADTVLIAEGYATGATLHETTGRPVAVAFDSNNLPAVAKAINNEWPDKAIIIAADNDQAQESEKGKNPGLEKSAEAASAVNGGQAIPRFSRVDRSLSDFNDMARESGKSSVQTNIEAAVAVHKQRSQELDKQKAQEARRERQEKGKAKTAGVER